MDGLFTPLSDLWSLGIVIWEIFTFAQIPYQTMSNQEVFSFISSDGARMQKPVHCPAALYAVVLQLWLVTPDSRPSHGEVLEGVERVRQDPAYPPSRIAAPDRSFSAAPPTLSTPSAPPALAPINNNDDDDGGGSSDDLSGDVDMDVAYSVADVPSAAPSAAGAGEAGGDADLRARTSQLAVKRDTQWGSSPPHPPPSSKAGARRNTPQYPQVPSYGNAGASGDVIYTPKAPAARSNEGGDADATAAAVADVAAMYNQVVPKNKRSGGGDGDFQAGAIAEDPV